ncbi:DUF5763 domain-containing protein [Moheibacter sp.]|uniref:DUF5763 domain-containing protein n=1 Tax=Moheibacter sp. TaxID=1965316 RepID=UPI003C782F5B
MKNLLLTLILFFPFSLALSQTVYKTPSGEKYHTATCRYVKNVSESMTIEQARRRGLSACSQCKPGSSSSSSSASSSNSLGIKSGEAQGSTSETVRCKGTTKSGTRCKHKTRNRNGYCHQHEPR